MNSIRQKLAAIVFALMLSSTSFVAKAEEWSFVILPCSHNEKDGALHFLLEKKGEQFIGIENTIKIEGVKGDDLSEIQEQDASKQANNTLAGIGLNKDNMVNIGNLNLSETDHNTLALTFLVDPAVKLKNQYVWIKADEASDKIKNTTDENLKNIINSTGWIAGGKKNQSFIDKATYIAKDQYDTLTFYLDSAKKNVFLKIKPVKVKVEVEKKTIFTLVPELAPFTTLAALKDEKVVGAPFSSNIFTIEYYGGIFARVIFKDASTLKEEEKKKDWLEVAKTTFTESTLVTEDKVVKINNVDYTIDKDIFNTLVTYLPQADKKVGEKTGGGKTKEGGEAGEKKGDAEAKEIVENLANSLFKLAKA